MTEKSEQSASSSVDAVPNASPAPVHHTKRSEVIADGFRNRTEGEKKFNRLTYGGVGYFGVTGFSVFLTWLLRDSKWLSPHYEAFTEKLVKSVEKSSLKKLSGFVYSNMTIFTLFIGGTVVSVLPVKWLEDNKSKIVQKFDRSIYGKDVVENDPDIKIAHAEMDAVPKQTWGSVLSSRILAFVTTLSISLLMGSAKSPLSKATGHSLDSLSTQVGRGVDRVLHKSNAAVTEAITEAETANRKWFTQPALMREDKASGILAGKGADRVPTRVASYIALDGFYTIFTSISLYVSTRLLAPFLGKKRPTTSPEPTASTPSTTVAAQPPVSTSPSKETPAPHVSQTTHQARIMPVNEQQLTA